MSNGNIYANINEKKLGNIKSTTLKEAIAKEIAQKGAWFRIRKNLIPCKSCIYNSYCPPVSNFEYVLHKNNLCNIDINRETHEN